MGNTSKFPGKLKKLLKISLVVLVILLDVNSALCIKYLYEYDMDITDFPTAAAVNTGFRNAVTVGRSKEYDCSYFIVGRYFSLDRFMDACGYEEYDQMGSCWSYKNDEGERVSVWRSEWCPYFTIYGIDDGEIEDLT